MARITLIYLISFLKNLQGVFAMVTIGSLAIVVLVVNKMEKLQVKIDELERSLELKSSDDELLAMTNFIANRIGKTFRNKLALILDY